MNGKITLHLSLNTAMIERQIDSIKTSMVERSPVGSEYGQGWTDCLQAMGDALSSANSKLISTIDPRWADRDFDKVNAEMRDLRDQVGRLQAHIDSTQPIRADEQGYVSPALAQEPACIPDDVRDAAKSMQKNGFRGPLAWAKKVIDFVADYSASDMAMQQPTADQLNDLQRLIQVRTSTIQRIIQRAKDQRDRDAAEHCPAEIIALQDEVIAALERMDEDCKSLRKSQTKLICENVRLQSHLDAQLDELLNERDHCHGIIDKLCDEVLGTDRNEWSSNYTFEDAVREVEESLAHRLKQLGQIHEPEGESGHYMPMRKTSAGNFVMALYAAPNQAEPQIHCPEKLKKGGCQLHNLHCGWPKCNTAPTPPEAQ
jgi:hypothetical protein